MKAKIIFLLMLALGGVLNGCSTPKQSLELAGAMSVANDDQFTKEVAAALKECQKIKPGMTRADLLKTFTTEGGLSTATHRTYVYRRCPYIKVDVEFTLSEPGQNTLEERLTDVISKVSKPYLEWSIID